MTVLLAVAHGSRDTRAQEVVGRLLAQAAQLRPGLRTAAAYVDNASPSVAVRLHDLRGEEVVVVPLLLTAASHSKTDVAASVQAGRAEGGRIRYGRPLGPHPVLVQVAARRLAEAGIVDEPVVLVAGGALDPDANAQVAATARLLFEGRAFASVDVAFASTASPTVGECLERLRQLGFSRAAVARYFLAPGRLPAAAATAAGSVEGIDVVVSEPLGAAPEIAALVLERYDEALNGDLRMNCDACLHRIPFPGREHAVGSPQLPHAHAAND